MFIMREDIEPIEIGRLQRYSIDWFYENWDKTKHMFKVGKPNGKTVACIGGGPASLSAAFYLAQLGYAVTIYDKNDKPGGLNMYGIARYKMSAEEALKEVKLVEHVGVKFKQKCEIGKDIKIDKLAKDSDAVFVGVGSQRRKTWGFLGKIWTAWWMPSRSSTNSSTRSCAMCGLVVAWR